MLTFVTMCKRNYETEKTHLFLKLNFLLCFPESFENIEWIFHLILWKTTNRTDSYCAFVEYIQLGRFKFLS